MMLEGIPIWAQFVGAVTGLLGIVLAWLKLRSIEKPKAASEIRANELTVIAAYNDQTEKVLAMNLNLTKQYQEAMQRVNQLEGELARERREKDALMSDKGRFNERLDALQADLLSELAELRAQVESVDAKVVNNGGAKNEAQH